MSEPDDNGAETGPDEHRFGERLSARRPVPTAAFRGALGRHLAASDPGYGPRPERLRLRIAGFLAAGSLLVIVGALQAAGAL